MPAMEATQPPHDSFASDLEICYEVLLYLSSRLARLKPGEALEYITGDPEAGEKVPTWCDHRDYTLLESALLPDGRYRFLIRK